MRVRRAGRGARVAALGAGGGRDRERAALESATAWSRQLESLQEISDALVGELDLPSSCSSSSSGCASDRRAHRRDRAPCGGRFTRRGGRRRSAETLLHETIPLESKIGARVRRGRSERVDSVIDDPEVVQDVARRFAAVTGLYVPLVSSGISIGIAFAHDKLSRDPRFTSADLRLAEHFAQRASVAVELSQRVQRDSLRRVFEGQELERRRARTRVHDETGQALTRCCSA